MNVGFLGQEESQRNRSVAEFIDDTDIDTEGVTQIGAVVFNSLQSDQFESARIFTAFARTSGVQQLERSIENSSAIDVELVVGVDHGNTSREALEELADLPIDARVYYHNLITYHPKVYYFEGGDTSRLIVGSSNLTNQGLTQNIEAAMVFETATDSDTSVIDDVTSFLDTVSAEAEPLNHDLIDQYGDQLGEEGTYTSKSGSTTDDSTSGMSIPTEITANTPVQSRSPAIPSDDTTSDSRSDSGSDDVSIIDTEQLPPRSEMPPIPSVTEFSTKTDGHYYSQLVNDPENQPSLLRRYIRAKGEVSKTELERVAAEEWGYSLSGSFGASLHVLTDVVDEVDTHRKNLETYYIWK